MREPSAHLLGVALTRLAAVVLALSLSSVAFAAELPPLRKGIWEFNRTVDGQGPGGRPITMINKKCADPSADMKLRNELLSRQGCKFATPTVKANTYTFAAECQVKGVAMQSQSTITVESDSAYSVQVISKAGGRTSKELLVAKRVGEC